MFEGTSGDFFVQPLLLKLDHLEQISQDWVHMAFGYL